MLLKVRILITFGEGDEAGMRSDHRERIHGAGNVLFLRFMEVRGPRFYNIKLCFCFIISVCP